MLNLSPTLKLFNQITSYEHLADALHSGDLNDLPAHPLGLLTGARPTLLAALQTDLQRPILFIAARADRARILAEQIQVWSEQPETVYRFPDPDALPHEKALWGYETIQGRVSALHALVKAEDDVDDTLPPLIVASARGLMHHTLPRSEFTTMTFKVGQRINLNEVVADWVALGYQPETVVEIPGSFSRRGGILDIFPTNSPAPVRIELFGDEIDSLRSFEPTTQRSENRLKQFTVAPATEALPRCAHQAAERLAQWDLSNLQPAIKIALEEDTERLGRGTAFRGIEYYLPFFYEDAPTSILDYLPDNALIFIEDPEELFFVIDELDQQAIKLKQDLSDVGDLPTEWPTPYFNWPALFSALTERNAVTLGFTQLSLNDEPSEASEPAPVVNQETDEATNGVRGQSTIDQAPYILQSNFVPAPTFGGQVKNVLEDVTKRAKAGERIILVSRQATRLSHLLENEANTMVAPQESLTPGDPPPPTGSLTLIQGLLIEGWSIKTETGTILTVMSDSEIFGWKKPTTMRRRKRRKGVTPETFFADVNPGDLVVHIEHGIGEYIGLVKLDFEGVEREYLSVKYSNNDKLYVPIHQADRLARYVGMEDHPPLLNRLGSADWNTVKRRARKSVEDIAKELLEIYAKREITPGRAFSPDTEWQAEIEDAFPFVETDDQLRAIEEVKADMEKPKAMDRLICGDVGYGKTEVALRAAFKATMDGVQVAILAPTTVLAQQHLQTFQQRLEAYPIQIESLSRFRTKSQQEKTIENLASGTADIVIGTHRLLQKDIVFKELGLLIIDEEQRFGVKQKERLKSLRAEVDVLTLSATPIPRTLHMSLTGVRDLSTIDTAPEERLPIQTTVTEYDEALIRKVILRELDRGGQVFYVYNRVMGIEQKANRIRNIVPEARVDVGHGQMSARQLERVMVNFIAGEFEVLVSTTIVESGLDMPNVNTIIIDRADRMGLSQLYQLRGRVGRGAQQAYAYLLTPKHYSQTPEATKRLEAIAEASELGAGFRIAMRDLEIRGAGDLLGAKQHGHIAAVGFDLYTRLLGQAVREIQGDTPSLVTGEEA
ncbi:MAG: transcription-repair coupling factor, partial [Chloroflexota bacterium]